MTAPLAQQGLDDHQRRRLVDAYAIPQHWGTARMTHRRIQNYVLAHLERSDGAVELQSLPLKLTIESTNICNLRCVACPTGLERRGRAGGHMSVELFSWLMAELGPTLFEVELHNWGEPLLGRNVFRFIEMATAHGVSSTISTNFSVPFDEERAERLVTAGLGILGVSIDGASQEAYEKYRVRGNLERVLNNCRMVANAKRRIGSETPDMCFSFHVFPHNVHEVETARHLAEEIGMRFSTTRGWVVGEEREESVGYTYPWGEGFPERCDFLWFRAVVHHDGGVAPCCGTFYESDDFDRVPLDASDLGRTSFRSIWNGTSFVAARRLFEERTGDESIRRLACFDCPVTVNFEGWKEALRKGATAFTPISSNDAYNFFLNRRGEGRQRLVQLRASSRGPH
jgi:MoaA/NifB/PqqE/SkfB family radical SAM enzyme